MSKMIQSGSSIIELINPFRVARKTVNKAAGLSNKKMSLNDVIKTTNISRNFSMNSKNVFGKGTTLTNNEMKDVIKVI